MQINLPSPLLAQTPESDLLQRASGAAVIAITSGKGGVGKTFFSANLACALAKRGRRVLLIDADLGLANLDVVLNLTPRSRSTMCWRARPLCNQPSFRRWQIRR